MYLTFEQSEYVTYSKIYKNNENSINMLLRNIRVISEEKMRL